MPKQNSDRNWPALNKAYQDEHIKTGITVKDWCKKHNIKLSSARRNIKRPSAQAIQNSKGTGAKKPLEVKKAEKFAKILDEPDLIQPPQPGHGFYRSFMDEDDIAILAESHTADLSAELGLMRVRAARAMKALTMIAKDLESADSVDQRLQLYDQYIKMESKLDWAIQRIESITNTIVNIKEKSVLVRLKMKKLNSSADKDLEQIKLIRKQTEEKSVIINMRKNKGEDDKVTYEIDW